MMLPLTPRQREVMTLFAHGHTEAEVAATLGISLQTVKNHAHEAYRTLGVTNRFGAFLELGWLTPPDAPRRRRYR